MTPVSFTAKILNINSVDIVLLPLEVSKKLPSRGPTPVSGTMNAISFHAVLEPDGRGSHWLKLDKNLLKRSKAMSGENIVLEIETSEQWPEPEVPHDLIDALQVSAKAQEVWKTASPNAHWDWVRWVTSTKDVETRARRVTVSISKLNSGMKRPCCFNRSMCCDPSVSKNGLLLV